MGALENIVVRRCGPAKYVHNFTHIIIVFRPGRTETRSFENCPPQKSEPKRRYLHRFGINVLVFSPRRLTSVADCRRGLQSRRAEEKRSRPKIPDCTRPGERRTGLHQSGRWRTATVRREGNAHSTRKFPVAPVDAPLDVRHDLGYGTAELARVLVREEAGGQTPELHAGEIGASPERRGNLRRGGRRGPGGPRWSVP